MKAEKNRTEKKAISGYEKCCKLLMLAGIVVMLVAAWQICSGLQDYSKADRLYDEAKQEYVSEKSTRLTEDDTLKAADSQDGGKEKADEWMNMISVNMEKLQEENADIAAWLYFENEDISYPVLYSGDNQTYLRKAYTGDYVTAGSIFMDGSNDSDFSDGHTLIYGHNMRDLSMFGRLNYYKTKEGYYDTHQYFQIITSDRYYRYRIFAYKDVTDTDGIYTVIHETQNELWDFVRENIMKGSYLAADEDIGNDGHVITLSTCTNGNGRFVVSAVRVDTAIKNDD